MNKPYNRCLHCEYLGNGCDGPRTSSMELDRWCEWLRDVKEAKGLTNQQIAEIAKLSVATVDRVMSGSVAKDLMRSTSTAIENATIGSNGKFPCYTAFLEEMPDESKTVIELQTELAQLRSNIGRTHDFQEKELATVRAEADQRISEMKEKHAKEIAHLKDQISYLRRLVDKLMEK